MNVCLSSGVSFLYILQIVIVPCGVTASLSDDDKNKLYDSCHELNKELNAAGVLSHADYRYNYSPGWKFNHWELKVLYVLDIRAFGFM